MMMGAYTSAEDRIKRNIKNIQRNESALDKNFARKWASWHILAHFLSVVFSLFKWIDFEFFSFFNINKVVNS